MTDFYIFRHGDTVDSGSLFAKIFGHKRDSHDLDILPKSHLPLEKIGNYLKDIPTDANFTSPYLRCLKSSQIVGGVAKKKFMPDERLREMEMRGESFSSLRDRVQNFLDEIHTKNYSAISICTHGAVIAAIKHLEIKGNFYFFQIWDYPSPGILTTITNKKISELNFNKG